MFGRERFKYQIIFRYLFTLSLVFSYLIVMPITCEADSSEPPLMVFPKAPENNDLRLSLRTDKREYGVGENAKISFELNKAAYVYILDFTQVHDVYLIYPNKWEGNNKKSSGTHVLPSGSYNFGVTGPAGTEYLQALATTKKIDIYQFVKHTNDPFQKSGFPEVPAPERLGEEIKSGLKDKFALSIGGEDQIQLTPVEWDTDFYNFDVVSSQPTNQPPTARFSYSPSNPSNGERVRFDGSDSQDTDGRIVKWEWDFDGDGTTDATGKAGYNTYHRTGSARVRLTVTDNDGATSTTSQYIQVGPSNQSPQADFGYSPSNPSVGDSVRFDGSSSNDTDGTIESWKWDFDTDGKTDSSGRVVWTRFDSSGDKRVVLSVTDDEGVIDSTSRTITVKRTNAELTVKVVDKTGDDLDARLYIDGEYQGDTGWDGEYTVSDISSGTYRVKVEKEGYYSDSVTNVLSPGEIEELPLTLKEKKKPPTAEFTYSPEEPKTGQQVTFNAKASTAPDGTIESYSWDLTGDGGTDKSGSKVTHTYEAKGNYTVKLTVTDNNEDTTSTTKQITVTKKEEPQQETEVDGKHALVIGISKYKIDLVRHLSYSKEDAEAFYSFLTEEGGFSKDKVKLLVNDEATTQNIRKSFSNLVTKTEKGDLVLIYYSGHGTYGPDYNEDEKDGHDEYYVTYDTNTSNGDKLYNTGISDDQFGNWINSLQSDKVAIVLDSCYSGGATKSAKTTNLSTHTGKAGPTNTVFNDFSFEDRLLFAASGENQQSFEAPPSADFNHGVFTHFMLKGLKGAADKDNDGNITAEDVYSYVKPKVQNYVAETFSSYNQTPLMKGVSTIPLVTREEKLTGEVQYVKGEDNTKATKDEFVMINLGREDGVKKGDVFRVYYTDEEAGTFRQVQGKLEIVDIAGTHLALGKVIQADYSVDKGDRVEKKAMD